VLHRNSTVIKLFHPNVGENQLEVFGIVPRLPYLLWFLRGILFEEKEFNSINEAVIFLRSKTELSHISTKDLIPFASFEISRYDCELVNVSCKCYLDCVQFSDADYYIVGTMRFGINEGEDLPILSDLVTCSTYTPVRSKIMEYLYINQREIYSKLEINGITEREYFSAPNLNHFPYNPIEFWISEQQALVDMYLKQLNISDPDMIQIHKASAVESGKPFVLFLEEAWRELGPLIEAGAFKFV